MKKKVLYGVALTLLAGASMGTLQSCKDDLSDLRQEVVYNKGDLIQKLDAVKTQLEAQITASGTACDVKIKDLQKQIDDLTAEIALKANKNDVDDAIKGLQTITNGLQESINNLQNELDNKADQSEVAALKTQIEDLTKLLDATKLELAGLIDGKADKSALDAAIDNLEAEIEKLQNKADQSDVNLIKKDLEDIKESIRLLKEGNGAVLKEIEDLKGLVAELQGQVADKAVIEGLQNDLNDLKEDLEQYTKDANSYADNAAGKVKEELEQKLTALQNKIENDLTAITARIDVLEEASVEYAHHFEAVDNEIAGLKGSISDLDNKCTLLSDKLVELSTQFATQQAVVEAMQTKLDEVWNEVLSQSGLKDQLASLREKHEQDIVDIKDKLADLSAEHLDLFNKIFGEGGLKSQVDENTDLIVQALGITTALREEIFGQDGFSDQVWAWYNENKDAIAALDGKLSEEMTMKLGELWVEIGNLGERIGANAAEIEVLKGKDVELEQSISDLDSKVVDFYNENKTAISNVAAGLEDVKASVKVLTCRMDKLITGIIVQSVDSPVFGNLSLPIGVQSNILFNWFGFNGTEAFEFPTNGTDSNYRPVDDNVDSYMAWKDWDLIGAPSAEIKKGFLGDVNIGKLFLTVNPAGNYFDKNGFTLETTSGKAYNVEFHNVRPSDRELYFGYSRAAERVEGNGFYEADIIIPEKEISAAKIEIEDGLKQTAKDLLKDPSKRTALNMLKAVYGQLNGMLPSYGVRYQWNVNGQDYSVVSNYNLAAATAKPLSYSFLWDKTISKRLREFGHIDNIILKLKEEGKLHFTFDEINFKDVNISLPPININPDLVNPETKMVTITIDPIHVTGDGVDAWTEPKTVDVPLESVVDDLAGEINEAISSITNQIKEWSDGVDLTGQVKEALDPIAEQINKMMASINGQIDEMLGDLGNQFQPYFDKLNKLVDLYNRVAGKINNILAEPNHYLQVAMFYNAGNGNLGVLSNSFESPTPFKAAGGNALGLYASSYTGELLAPAYKKYVAVSNIYDENKDKVTTKEALAAINGKGKFLNEVKDGDTIRFGISASSLKKNYTYEIIYQGVDYYGKTSTQKFYITVK